VVDCPFSCNILLSTMWLHSIPTYLKSMQIGKCVFHAVLMLKMVIHPKHALPLGDRQITRRGLIGAMQVNTSQQGTVRALRPCTKVSCLICDGVGQSR
jgi:hypothetical protein